MLRPEIAVDALPANAAADVVANPFVRKPD